MFKRATKEFGKLVFGGFDLDRNVIFTTSAGESIAFDDNKCEIIGESGLYDCPKKLYDKNTSYIMRRIDSYRFNVTADGELKIGVRADGGELRIYTRPNTTAIESVIRYIDECGHLDGSFDATGDVYDGKGYSRIVSYGGAFDEIAIDHMITLLRETTRCVC